MKIPNLVKKQNLFFFIAIFILVIIISSFAGSISSMFTTIEGYQPPRYGTDDAAAKDAEKQSLIAKCNDWKKIAAKNPLDVISYKRNCTKVGVTW